jgi:hypothetical protein
MVDIILKLSFVNDMVDLLSNTLNSAVPANLPNDVLVVLRLPEFQALINRLGTVSNDIFKFKRSKLCPFFFHSSQGNSWVFAFIIFVLMAISSTCVQRLISFWFVLTIKFNSSSLIISWVEYLLRGSLPHVQIWSLRRLLNVS